MAFQKQAKWVPCVEAAMQNAISQSPRWRGFIIEDLTAVCGIVLSLPLDYARTHVAEADIKTSKKKMKRVYCCVALGSGTRCVGAGSCTSAIQTSEMTDAQRVEEAFRMHDGHAEVMARRAFVAFLLQHATMLMEEGRTSDGLLRLRSYDVSGDGDDDVNGAGVRRMDGFELQPEVQLHLVSTRWMCGGMALAMTGETGGRRLLRSPMASLPGHETTKMEHKTHTLTTRGTAEQGWVDVKGHRVAAHVTSKRKSNADEEENDDDDDEEEDEEEDEEKDAAPTSITPAQVCACCVKPGKGPPHLSMSCSDKVWRWANFGVQGRRRSLCFTTPMYMESLHVAIPEDATTENGSNTDALVRLFHNKNRALRPDTRAHAPPAPLFSAFCADFVFPDEDDDDDERDESEETHVSRGAWVQNIHPLLPKAAPKNDDGDDDDDDDDDDDNEEDEEEEDERDEEEEEEDEEDEDEEDEEHDDHDHRAPQKRQRTEETTSSSTLISLRWTKPTSMQLNTTTGYLQGMTIGTLHSRMQDVVERCSTASKEGSENVRVDDDASRACIHAVEKMLPVCASMTDPFPLSRAWMAARVLKLVHLIHESGRPTLLQTWAEEMKVKADVSSVSCFMESWMPWVDGLWATAPRVERLPLTNNNNNNNMDGDVPRFPPRLGGRMPFHVMNEAGALAGTKDEAEVLPLVWVEKSATMS